MARPRKPAELLSLSGSFKKNPSRFRPPGPKSARPLGSPPAFLDKSEAAAWKEIAGQAAPGLLAASDRVIVEFTARLLARMRQRWLTGAEMTQLRAALNSLGLSPSGRSYVTALPDEPSEDSSWSEFTD